MTKVDNSTYQIVNIPLDWYYLILNEKSKKPDYSVIMILAVLAGSYFNSHVDNQDFIKSFSKEWLELLNDIYKSADEYENTEKHSFFYGMLEKYDFIKNGFVQFWIDFIVYHCIIWALNYKQFLCLVLLSLLKNGLSERRAVIYGKGYFLW